MASIFVHCMRVLQHGRQWQFLGRQDHTFHNEYDEVELEGDENFQESSLARYIRTSSTLGVTIICCLPCLLVCSVLLIFGFRQLSRHDCDWRGTEFGLPHWMIISGLLTLLWISTTIHQIVTGHGEESKWTIVQSRAQKEQANAQEGGLKSATLSVCANIMFICESCSCCIVVGWKPNTTRKELRVFTNDKISVRFKDSRGAITTLQVKPWQPVKEIKKLLADACAPQGDDAPSECLFRKSQTWL